MSDEADPEVVADLQLRSASERDRTRSRDANYAWSAPDYVDNWPCRGGCGAMVPVTEDAIERAQVFDRQLARVGDENGSRAPLDRTRIVFCDKCKSRGLAAAPERNRRHVEAMALLIRELRGGTTNPAPPGPAPSEAREFELIQKLKAMKHPDVDGLVQTIRDKRRAQHGAKLSAKDVLK